ncbi:hypothetical protein [Halopenitus persicus]|uniref:hypothetical protein n=1 Tax=Halopenitus persicus TaxID=1048396 RepID=UPI000BBA43F0|nr:hypothetical protein [Halopenitus persicus]
MPATRRRALQLVGATTTAALAGCSMPEVFDSESTATEYTLRVDRISTTPIEHALYDPDDSPLFGDPARTAIAAILPEGRHMTLGYTPLPADAYLHDERTDTYHQVKRVVTGRRRRERTLVRLTPVSNADSGSPGTDASSGSGSGAAPEPDEDPLVIETLDRPDERVLTILYSHHVTDGAGASSELLRGDAYVLRRPAERNGRLAAGDLDGRTVAIDAESRRTYRIDLRSETLREPEHVVTAVRVADSPAAFREVVLETRVDAEIDRGRLSADADDLLDRAIARGEYTETAPRSDAFRTLLAALGLERIESSANGRLLWDGQSLYRYALYVSEPS